MLTASHLTPLGSRLALGVFAFGLLGLLIASQPAWKLTDFDQHFYTKLAYDLDKYGVFSNGPFNSVDSTITAPAPGMFFGPAYPVLVLAAMKLDQRFADAVRCSVEAHRKHRDENTCEAYLTPIRLMNAFLLSIGVIAVGTAAELIFRRRLISVFSGTLALTALALEADIFSYIMTESTSFSLYTVLMLTVLLAWRTRRIWQFGLSGLLLGALCLTKPSFLVLFPAIAAATFLHGFCVLKATQRSTWAHVLAFTLAFALVIGTWVIRNTVSVGKVGLTEEYGAAVLIERFAYNDMRAREFLLAFPYCTPGLGDVAFDLVYGNDSMHRFVFHTPDSFFHVGRGWRDKLVEEYGRIDPIIRGIFVDEMRTNWWRHILVSIPLAWCGMWAGWIVSLFLVPLFCWAVVRALRAGQLLLPLYAAPAVIMLALHAAVGNHYTRYNLILVGPYAVGAAWIIWSWLLNAHWRWRSLAQKP